MQPGFTTSTDSSSTPVSSGSATVCGEAESSRALPKNLPPAELTRRAAHPRIPRENWQKQVEMHQPTHLTHLWSSMLHMLTYFWLPSPCMPGIHLKRKWYQKSCVSQLPCKLLGEANSPCLGLMALVARHCRASWVVCPTAWKARKLSENPHWKLRQLSRTKRNNKHHHQPSISSIRFAS